MKSYQEFSISTFGLKCLEGGKGSAFVQQYFKDHGEYPTVEVVNQAKALTPAELEKYKRLYYANYVTDFAQKSEIVQPEINPNTPEQEEVETQAVETLLAGNKNVVVEEGTINNITIPAEVTVLANITGELQDGATITSESTKAFTVNNTSEEPVNASFEANGTVYLTGKFENVYLDGKTLGAASGKYAEVSGEVSFAPEVEGNVGVTANFVGDNAGVKYVGDQKLTISNAGEEASLSVFAPGATVEMGGMYDVVNATVSDDTLILKNKFHARALNVKAGKVMFYGTDIKDFVSRPIDSSVEVNPYTLDITSANVAKMSANPGVYNLVENATTTSAISFGMFGSGKYSYNLNGFNLTCGTERNGSLFVRGAATVDINGPGKFANAANGYGVWCSGSGCTINVNGGDFEAYTHVLYAENGVINVYGGSFKLLGEYDKDPKGHAKFLLNCLDAGYLSGKAKINVFGGKFYNYNPAESYSEPSGPVNFVAPGYHVVETEEEGVPVFEVVKD